MSFQPVVPLGGYAGWRFLERTMERQQEAFNKSTVVQRDLDYFAEKIGKVTNAEELVGDYRLLKVALGAFGLQDDIGSKFFIRKVLSEGTSARDALANKLADKSYFKLAEAFGFGGVGAPRTQEPGFAEEIAEAYRERSFEIAVGEQNDDMRLALNVERELTDLASNSSGDDSKWFSIMGSSPLRQVFDTAFGLPTSFAAIDLDRQLEVYREKAEALFGSSDAAQFADPDKREQLIKMFLVRSEISAGSAGYSSGQIALTLLGG
ncbi:DUF1217 domain-containing protein [Rhodovulum euryhalinum]|uniref:Uncharacterized protein DUF1217 n=1 Tax=Rhodovulum euryhalinum TaxID=35805 RepID=A0A4R2KLG8_9RHOB|nr:DUF1217 domain-containing protein [Rhodovulum euryhalinum]TCO73357.1 uncharacterized protein DUF1217 [Rhodovulum euryhalinum]